MCWYFYWNKISTNINTCQTTLCSTTCEQMRCGAGKCFEGWLFPKWCFFVFFLCSVPSCIHQSLQHCILCWMELSLLGCKVMLDVVMCRERSLESEKSSYLYIEAFPFISPYFILFSSSQGFVFISRALQLPMAMPSYTNLRKWFPFLNRGLAICFQIWRKDKY